MNAFNGKCHFQGLPAPELNQLYDWLTANKLSVNVEKTSYMTFPRDKDNETLLCMNNQVVNKVTSCRYLGVIIDDELKWTDQINHVYKQESPAIADKPARRESMPKIAPIRRAYNVVADNTGLSSCVYLLLRPKSAKSREIH